MDRTRPSTSHSCSTGLGSGGIWHPGQHLWLFAAFLKPFLSSFCGVSGRVVLLVGSLPPRRCSFCSYALPPLLFGCFSPINFSVCSDIVLNNFSESMKQSFLHFANFSTRGQCCIAEFWWKLFGPYSSHSHYIVSCNRVFYLLLHVNEYIIFRRFLQLKVPGVCL